MSERDYYKVLKVLEDIEPTDTARADIAVLASTLLKLLEPQLPKVVTKPRGLQIKVRVVAVAQNNITVALNGASRDVYSLSIPAELTSAFALNDLLTITIGKTNA